MSNGMADKATVLNWRGVLLAAGIFATVFAILLLMAHQNQSRTSDMGSSLREDPYGTSLLFDSYARAGHQVKRSQDEDSLFDQNAITTTAFFIGGFSTDFANIGRAKSSAADKFRARLEDFLARGGRVVLIAPTQKLKSESQGWEVESKWYERRHESGPTWVSPDQHAMPAGSENMYLSNDAPWLNIDDGWTVLYAEPADAAEKSDSSVHVYMASRKVGNGQLVAASQESFLLNEAIKAHPNPALLDFLAGGRPVIWIDETLHGLHQDQGVLWLVQRYRLQAALLLFWATLLTLLWSMSGDLVRRPARVQSAQVVRSAERAGVAARRLLQRSIDSENVVAECWAEFSRRSPQDAQAILGNPESGPRLRDALAQPPLTGYRQLSQLITERRAFARGLSRPGRDSGENSNSSPSARPQEARSK
jgi:hypothetical protein